MWAECKRITGEVSFFFFLSSLTCAFATLEKCYLTREGTGAGLYSRGTYITELYVFTFQSAEFNRIRNNGIRLKGKKYENVVQNRVLI